MGVKGKIRKGKLALFFLQNFFKFSEAKKISV